MKGGREGGVVTSGEEGHRWRGLRGGKVPQGPCAPLAARNREGADGSGGVAEMGGRRRREPVGAVFR
jgi:hypothetical protein